MKEIELKEIPAILDAAPLNACVMLIGDTGIGKTQIITKYAEENGYFLKTLILSQLEASESLGIPVQSTRVFNGVEYKTLDTAIPNWVFELAEHDKALLFLDEFLCCEPAVMNAMLNFLTEKKVHGIDLSHVKVVAATNIGNYTYEPDNNILSRFCMFYAVNNEYNSYLKTKYKGSKIKFENNYVDREDRDGVIFEPRSLKPRCQEILYMLNNPAMFDAFYEGFTNQAYKPKFHGTASINEIVSEFVQKENDTWKIKYEDMDNLAALLFAKVKDNKKVQSASERAKYLSNVCEFKRVQYDKYDLLRRLTNLIDNASDNY